MYSVTSQLVRRGLDFAQSPPAEDPHDGSDKIVFKLSPMAAATVFATCLLFVALISAINYAYGCVVGTLAIVEDPQVDEYVAVDSLASPEDDDGMPKPPTYSAIEPDVLLVKRQPITSSIRNTIRHLRARAGYWAPFRGLSLFIFWVMSRSLIAGFLTMIGLRFVPAGFAIASICAEVILAPFELTWYHVVISEPSQNKWWKRVPSFRSSWAKIAPVVAVRAVTDKITSVMPLLLCQAFGTMNKFKDPAFEPSKKDIRLALAQSLLVLLLTFAFILLLEFPATVTVARVAASMLPDENETIIPFDRSFGGKVTPAIVGGAGKIGMVEAWKSFTWSSRVRLLKLIGKVFAMILALWIVFMMVMGAEVHAFLGPKAGEALRAMSGTHH